MPDILAITCPSCGAKLTIPDGIEMLICASCGIEHTLHRDGGAIYLAPDVEDVWLAKEIATIEAELQATLDRGRKGWVSQEAINRLCIVDTIILVSSIFVHSRNILLGLFLSFVGIVIFIIITVMLRIRVAKITKVRQAELNRIKTLIASKKAQLKKNQVVSASA